ncbi:MAG: dihydroneopterin aldolase [Burkholderiales bacterium]
MFSDKPTQFKPEFPVALPPQNRDTNNSVFIRELKLPTIIGVYDYERLAPQTLQFELEIGMRDTAACFSDDISDTADYALVVARIREELVIRQFFLLERLGQHLGRMIINEFHAPWVKISIAKTGIVPDAKQVGVNLEFFA